MYSSAIDHGAKVTHSHRLTSIHWIFYPRVWEVEIKQPFLREERALLKNLAMYTYTLFTCSVLQKFSTPQFSSNDYKPDHINTTDQAL